MRRKEQLWWVSATVLSLAAFSFFAGLGLRGLFERLTQNPHSDAAFWNYPRIASAAPRFAADPNLKPAALYWDVLNKLRVYYVEKLPSNTQLSYGSVDAMLNQLGDPNTRLVSKTEVDALRDALTGEYSGIGALLTIRRYNDQKPDVGAAAAEDAPQAPGRNGLPTGVKMVTVVSVAPGSPAEKAGLRPGDRITELDGQWIAPMHVSYRILTQLTDPLGPQDGRPRDQDEPVENKPKDPEQEKARKEAETARARWKNSTDLASTMRALYGEAKGQHELTVERGTPAKTSKLKVDLGSSSAPVFSSRKLGPGTGYLQIRAFSGATAKQAGEALAGFQKSGVKNLVVDLRGSAGGSLDAARDVAGMLLGDVKFAVLKQRDADRKLVDKPLATDGAASRLKPSGVSVLVDGGTAGVSELLAAALRDHAGAKLVGTATFGDGTEQELIRLENGAGVSITRAKMLTSRGADFDGKGLQADVAPQGDPVEAAVKALPTTRASNGRA
jgi:carboxyl-terminal processing protease